MYPVRPEPEIKTEINFFTSSKHPTMGKKVAIGTGVAFVTLMILGYVTFELLLKSSMESMYAAAGNCMNTGTPAFTFILLATLVQSLLIAALMAKFGVNAFQSGFIQTAWVVLLVILWFDIWFLASFPWFTQKMMIMDVATNTLMSAVAGGVVGWVYGRVK